MRRAGARTTSRFGGRLDLILFGVFALLAFIVTILPARMHQPVARGLRRSVVTPLVSLQRSSERWRAAWASSQERAIARDSLALRAAAAVSLEAENDRLRRALGLGRRLQFGFAVAEALHAGGSAEQFSVVLTAGSNAGVAPGAPVVAPEGLVGTVQTVDPSMSLAIIYPHPDFRASAMSADRGAFGIVAPHISGAAPDHREGQPHRPDRFMLEMRGVPTRRQLKPGTLIVTSGLGGTYPEGIPIGTVVGELKTPEVWAKTYLLRPVVSPNDITSVMILKGPKVREGTGAVWEAPTNPDSAERGVAAAGDSLARFVSAAEAARRAALDSAVRASRPDTLRADSLAGDSTRLGTPPAAGTTTGGTTSARPVVPPVARPVTPPSSAPRPVAPVRRDTLRRDPPRPDTLRTSPP